MGDLVQAEQYAQQGLAREEIVVRAYCLYLLGEVRRFQGHYTEGERLCRDAIAVGESLQDLWALGPAWRALGELYLATAQPAAATDALQQALTIYRQIGVTIEIEQIAALLANLIPAEGP